jgi:hypothetical protein
LPDGLPRREELRHNFRPRRQDYRFFHILHTPIYYFCRAAAPAAPHSYSGKEYTITTGLLQAQTRAAGLRFLIVETFRETVPPHGSVLLRQASALGAYNAGNAGYTRVCSPAGQPANLIRRNINA